MLWLSLAGYYVAWKGWTTAIRISCLTQAFHEPWAYGENFVQLGEARSQEKAILRWSDAVIKRVFPVYCLNRSGSCDPLVRRNCCQDSLKTPEAIDERRKGIMCTNTDALVWLGLCQS